MQTGTEHPQRDDAFVQTAYMTPGCAHGASDAPYPGPRRAFYAFAVLAAIAFFVGLDISLSALLIEPLKRDLRLSDIEVGLAQGAAFGVAYAVSSLPIGALIDRWNRVRMMIAGLIVWGAAMTLAGFSTGLAALILSRVSLGIVTAILSPGPLSVLSDLFPPHRRAVAVSLYSVGGSLGGAAAILAGGLLFDTLSHWVKLDPGALWGLAPWRALYVGFGLLALALVPFLAMVREPLRQERGAAASAGRFRELWAFRRALAPLLGAMMFLAGSAQAMGAWAAPALMRLYDRTPGQFAGWMSMVTLFAGATGLLAGGQLAELGRRKRGISGMLVPGMFAALLCIPGSFAAASPNVVSFAVLMGLLLMACGMGTVVVVIGINIRMPNELRGVTLGLNVLVMALFGAGLAPTAVPLAARLLGGDAMLGYAIALVAAPCALMSALMFWIAARQPGLDASGAAGKADEQVHAF